MTSGLLLRLAGPLQSWGERSVFDRVRDSAPFPTRSAMIGMFAAAQGVGRDGSLDAYRELQFTVRIDRQGQPLVDYHTAGGGYPDELTPATSGGKHKRAAVITHRHYLADAVFVVAVTAPGSLVSEIGRALRRPTWAPYLGRRSCPPDEPLVLATDHPDPVAALHREVPLSRPVPRTAEGTVPVTFIQETPPTDLPEQQVKILDVNDRPESFARHSRAHSARKVYEVQRRLPAELLRPQRDLMDALLSYAQIEEQPA